LHYFILTVALLYVNSCIALCQQLYYFILTVALLYINSCIALC